MLYNNGTIEVSATDIMNNGKVIVNGRNIHIAPEDIDTLSNESIIMKQKYKNISSNEIVYYYADDIDDNNIKNNKCVSNQSYLSNS